MKQSKTETKAEARAAYVIEGAGTEEIARRLGKSEATIRRYKGEDAGGVADWDKARVTRTASRAGVAEGMDQAVADVAEEIKATLGAIREAETLSPLDRVKLISSLSDSLVKVVKAARKFDPEVLLDVIVAETLEIVAAALTRKSPPAAQALVEVLDEVKEEIFKRKKAWQG